MRSSWASWTGWAAAASWAAAADGRHAVWERRRVYPFRADLLAAPGGSTSPLAGVSALQDLFEETLAAQLHTEVIALETRQQVPRLFERTPLDRQTIELVQIQAQSLFERPQRARVDGECRRTGAPGPSA